MIVCLDATPLTMTSGGLPRYVAELSAALAQAFRSDRFLLSSDQPFSSELAQLPYPANWIQKRWWLYGAECANGRAGVEVFHGTNFAVPYFSSRPTVMTIHDLSPWMNPAWHSKTDRVRKRAPRMIDRATMIVTPTQAVKQGVIEKFRLPPSKVAVTHLAAAAAFRPVSKPAACPYFLFVGTLEPRKSVPMLLEAWREVWKHHQVELILAGRRRDDFPALAPEEGLVVLGEMPEDALPALYSNAIAVIYPSEYEGFGLPVLEAMQCGAPVIISRDPALTEVSGGAALPASSAAEMAELMLSLVRIPELRAERAERSLARSRDFSWNATARLTYEVYREAIARFGR